MEEIDRNFYIGKHELDHKKKLLKVDLDTVEGKLTARMFAYLLWVEGYHVAANKLFRVVGK